MNYTLDIPPISLYLGAGALLAALILLVCYRSRIASVRKRRQINASQGFPVDMPDVSVIVYCDNTPAALGDLMHSLLTQKYSGHYEVVIVNDGSSEDVKDVFNRLSLTHDNIYLTFIPGDAHNISRRKLAITLGVKGARYDNVLVIDATSSIVSSRWMAAMARHFANGASVVIGHAVYNRADDKSWGKRRRSFETSADALTYLSAAIAGHPYRAHGGNMGFTRKLFFDAKGFARSLNLHYGDDDIFISQIANGNNTAVEISPRARVILGGESPKCIYRNWKRQHLFTGRYVSRASRRLMGFYILLLWVGTALAVASAVTAWPNLVPAAVMTVVGLAVWGVLMWTWRKAVRALGGRRMALTLPWLLLTRPLYGLKFALASRTHRERNFTWAPPR